MNYNQENFTNEIINLECNFFFDIKDPELAWKMLVNKIEPILNRHCPRKA